MKKIISLFARNYDGDRLVRDEIVPGAEWVAAGEGFATIKLDGTSCLIRDGKLYKRYDAKRGKTPPAGFIPAQDPDPITGHHPGWLPVGDGLADQWHREAWETLTTHDNGTYELVGPKVQGNPYHLLHNYLWRHGDRVTGAPRDFARLREWLAAEEEEGIVWWRDLHNPDCDKVKIKRRDFGLPWPIKPA